MTRTALWMSAAVAAVLACTACTTTDSLAVAVTHPAALDAMVTRTTVSVYAASSIVTCSAIEYAEIPDTTLDGALVASADVMAGSSGGLTGVPRDEDKVVVARGYDGSGDLIAAGCSPVGVVDGTTTVMLVTTAAATLAITAADVDDPIVRTVLVTDPTGAPLNDRQIAWTVYGFAGSVPASMTNVTIDSDGVWESTQPSCTDGGQFTIHPVPPTGVGGYAVQVRAAWSATTLPLYSGLDEASTPPTMFAADAGTLPAHVCAAYTVGSNAELACSSSDATPALAIDNYELTGSGSAAAVTLTSSVPAGVADILAVLADGGVPYVVSLSGRLYQIDFGSGSAGSGSVIEMGSGVACNGSGLCTLKDVALVPACGSAAAHILTLSPSLGFATMNLDGTDEMALPVDLSLGSGSDDVASGADINSAGCITYVDASGVTTVEQAFVLDLATTKGVRTIAATRVYYACGSAMCAQALPYAGAGVGFSPGTSPVMVGTTFDAEGAALLEWTVGSDHLIERERLPSASFPSQIVFGQFDDDNQIDLAWDIAAKQATGIEVSYARSVEGEPLSTLGSVGAVVVELGTADFDGNGYDDLFAVAASATVATSTSLTSYTITISPTGVPANVTAGSADATCAP